jgi:hypothetical protein
MDEFLPANIPHGEPLECSEAAKLFNRLEAIAALAPRIVTPRSCGTESTLSAIPSLLTGRFRAHRHRLMRGYLRAIRVDIHAKLVPLADEFAREGHWAAYFRIRLLLLRIDAQIAWIGFLGVLFVARLPVKLEPPCQSAIRLVERAGAVPGK